MKETFSNLTDKNIILVVENFGLNFSGGSTATAIVFEYFEPIFREVIILCSDEGHHNLQTKEIYKYEDTRELSLLIDKYVTRSAVAFGDFHVAKALLNREIPYFFVYHDNYPDMKDFGMIPLGEHDKMIATYGSLFAQSNHVFSVSEYKLDFIKQYTSKVSVVRNGLSQKVTKLKQRIKDKNTLKVLMAGNIDERKYSKAIEVFDHLKSLDFRGIEIDIYGNSNHETLEKKLNSYSFVSYLGYKEEVNYDDYDVYLNTSLAENLSLSVVDALANRTPVVSFDVGGINEVISTRKNGVVIPTFQSGKMAKTLISIKENGLLFTIDQNDLAEFDWRISAQKMLSIMNLSLQN